MEKLFSYGTLQMQNVQLETFGRLLNGAEDSLVGFVLSEVKITDADVIAKSGTNIHPILRRTNNSDDKVKGTVFEITAEELAKADEYEVDDYIRVEAKFLSSTVAWVYTAASD